MLHFRVSHTLCIILTIVVFILPQSVRAGIGLYTVTLWPGGIVYYQYDAALTQDKRDIMRQAMDDWEAVTSVQFVEQAHPDGYVNIIEDNDCSGSGNPCGNYSFVGYQGNVQDLSIVSWSTMRASRHELGHALGLLHEHVRPDRDTYVTVDLNSIPSSQRNNYLFRDNGFGYGEYGFDSVMHYPVAPLNPYITLNPGYEQFASVTFSPTISPDDAKVVDFLYEGETNQTDGMDDPIVIGYFGFFAPRDFMGDNVSGDGGNDTIMLIPGTTFDGNLFGDGLSSASSNGGQDSLVIDSDLTGNVSGDGVGGNGASDTIVVNGTIDGTVLGDAAGGDGADDSIMVNGTVSGAVFGDDADGTAGNDNLTVGVMGGIGGDLYGDDTTGASGSGNDTIIVNGTVIGDVIPDRTTGDGGDDIIYINGSIGNTLLAGDSSSDGNGGNDTIAIGTSVTANIVGDNVAGMGGDDSITIIGTVIGDVGGDGANLDGGMDTITVSGSVSGSIEGDGVGGNGAADTIAVDGVVSGNVLGDDALGTGGSDSILISGTVGGNVEGDGVIIDGGTDTITVAGSVTGDVIGDDANGTGGNDSLTINTGASVNQVIGDLSSGQGGNDTIIVSGSVLGSLISGDQDGTPGTGAGGNDSILLTGAGVQFNGIVAGDKLDGTVAAGDDTIEVTTDVNIIAEIRGDDIGSGLAGDDSVVINGTVFGDIVGDNAMDTDGGDDTIAVGGSVTNVVGDRIVGGGNGGQDSIFINAASTVNGGISGDEADGDGGDDTIALAVGSSVVDDVEGDTVSGDGGNDLIVIDGSVGGDVKGDNTDGNGGADTIALGTSSHINGVVAGDGVNNLNSLGGKDSIVVHGSVGGNVNGDNAGLEMGRSGRDTISVGVTATVIGSVNGDFTKKAGSQDSITIAGNVMNSVFGDNTNRAGGADEITIAATGVVGVNVVGDLVKTIQGGDDLITIAGVVNKHVIGDGFRGSAKADANGGDDTIVIEAGGSVARDVYGDDAPNNGGDDSIVIAGTVGRDVIGDKVSGQGGIDTIEVRPTGVVQGDIVGDDAGTPANAGNGGDDMFILIGSVVGDVYLDNRPGPALDIVSDTGSIDLAIGGNDVIVVAGQITGNISSATGSDGDDVFVIVDGGVVGGVMDAGSHVDGDSLVFDLSTKSKGEFGKLSALFDDLTIEEGGVAYRGNEYRWVNFEFLQYAVQLLQTRTVPLSCSGIYEKNADGTACVRKGQEEYDAIMFHRNNPGYDGRLPGTEACAIYNYGNAMRVYEVVDGSEGELVTTISADVFSHNIESNLLLASSASGNVKIYYLTSNEVQVECRDWSGKTQVRIIPDFSGTVSASFDKVGG